MNDRATSGDNEALPWLEAVDDEDQPRGVSARKMFGALLMVGIAVAIIAGTLFYLGRQSGGSGPPELIRADAGPYKIKPTDPGGLDVAGDSGTAFATGAGEDQDSRLDVGKMAEPPPPLPVAGEEKPTPPPAPKPVAPPVVAEATPAVPGAAGPTVQLGAYGSTAKAETAWRMLSSRFPAVGSLTKQIVPYSGGFRLRAGAASTEQAKAACAAVTAGGENCFVVR
ncbi:SPOR domain-containing protein [Sphingomonas sp.]|uniref:SPOR domain-containing protein n=1 Tax=Sphingomonas sp. TaxID=28214 RepID=UPI00286B5586|nr:SPOR domain-containing protein [Sphingomonas sp.]